MKLLITGIGGMLGSDLADELYRDFVTTGIVRRPVDFLPVPAVVRDLEKREDVIKVVLREKPAVILHAAAMTDVDGCESRRYEALRDNVEATKAVTEAANAAGAFLIFFSTDYVFDGAKGGEYSEDELCKPLNVYGETKWLAEQYIQHHAAKYIIFRLSWLFGLRGRSFPRTLLEKSASMTQFRIVSDQYGRPTYTRDVAKVIRFLLSERADALFASSGEVFHLAGADICSWFDFAAYLFDCAGLTQVRLEAIPTSQFPRPAKRPLNSALAVSKIRERLGVELPQWKDSIARFVQEYRNSKLHGVRHAS